MNSNYNAKGLDIEKISKMLKEQQVYLDKQYPTDIPSDVCNHAFIQGIKFENSFMPKVHDFVSFMKCGNEVLFL
jgi:hypothetical protein